MKASLLWLYVSECEIPDSEDEDEIRYDKVVDEEEDVYETEDEDDDDDEGTIEYTVPDFEDDDASSDDEEDEEDISQVSPGLTSSDRLNAYMKKHDWKSILGDKADKYERMFRFRERVENALTALQKSAKSIDAKACSSDAPDRPMTSRWRWWLEFSNVQKAVDFMIGRTPDAVPDFLGSDSTSLSAFVLSMRAISMTLFEFFEVVVNSAKGVSECALLQRVVL